MRVRPIAIALVLLTTVVAVMASRRTHLWRRRATRVGRRGNGRALIEAPRGYDLP